MLTTTEKASILMQVGLVPYVVGNPGVGKTSVIEQMGKSFAQIFGREIPVVTINPHMFDPLEICGLPVISDGGYKISAPPWFVELAQLNGPAILFLDEVSSLPPASQAKLLRLLAHRYLNHGLKLPETVMMIASGNPAETATDAFLFDPAFASRLCFLEWDMQTSFDSWSRGLIAGCKFPSPRVVRAPDNWRDKLPIWGTAVAGFVRSHSEFECAAPSNGDASSNQPWPTRRTWTYAVIAAAAVDACGGDEDDIASVITGCVGKKAALSFMSWRAVTSVVDPEELLNDAVARMKRKAKVVWPEKASRLDVVFAVVSALLSLLSKDPSDEKYAAVAALLVALSRAGFAEAAAHGAIALHQQYENRALPDELIQELESVAKAIDCIS